MKIDWQHFILFVMTLCGLLPQALGPLFPGSSAVGVGLVIVGVIGMALKESMVPSVNVSAAVKTGLVAVAGSVLLCLALAGCLASGAPTPAAATIEGDILKGIPLACVVADVLDPALMTPICAVVDTADNLLTPPVTPVAATPAIAAAFVAAHPASPAVALKLRTIAAMKASAARSTALAGH